MKLSDASGMATSFLSIATRALTGAGKGSIALEEAAQHVGDQIRDAFVLSVRCLVDRSIFFERLVGAVIAGQVVIHLRVQGAFG